MFRQHRESLGRAQSAARAWHKSGFWGTTFSHVRNLEPDTSSVDEEQLFRSPREDQCMPATSRTTHPSIIPSVRPLGSYLDLTSTTRLLLDPHHPRWNH